MFFQRQPAAPKLVPERLLGLRLSLNAPVLAGLEIANGPARAAIAAHCGEAGAPEIVIGIRSLRTGEVVFYGFDGEVADERSVAMGVDAALSFAEGMGFLFDDEEIRPEDTDSRLMACGLWLELMGGEAAERPAAPPPPVAQPAAKPAAAAKPSAAAAPRTQRRPASAPPRQAEPLPLLEIEDLITPPTPESAAAITAPALTKFRAPRSEAAPAAGASGAPAAGPPASPEPPAAAGARAAIVTTGRAPLARLKLVRRRSGGATEDRRSWIVRLLASF